MNILVAIKREEKKLERQLHKLQGHLAGVRTRRTRSNHGEEASAVGGGKSENRGRQKALGKSQEGQLARSTISHKYGSMMTS